MGVLNCAKKCGKDPMTGWQYAAGQGLVYLFGGGGAVWSARSFLKRFPKVLLANVFAG